MRRRLLLRPIVPSARLASRAAIVITRAQIRSDLRAVKLIRVLGSRLLKLLNCVGSDPPAPAFGVSLRASAYLNQRCPRLHCAAIGSTSHENGCDPLLRSKGRLPVDAGRRLLGRGEGRAALRRAASGHRASALWLVRQPAAPVSARRCGLRAACRGTGARIWWCPRTSGPLGALEASLTSFPASRLGHRRTPANYRRARRVLPRG